MRKLVAVIILLKEVTLTSPLAEKLFVQAGSVHNSRVELR